MAGLWGYPAWDAISTDDRQIGAMAAVGRPGDPEDLPLTLQEKEKPSQRKSAEEFVFKGGFGK